MNYTRYWYTYNGAGSDLSINSYVAPSITQPNCVGGRTASAIYVAGGRANPDPGSITQNITNYLAIAKANNFSFYPLTGKPYVGTRD